MPRLLLPLGLLLLLPLPTLAQDIPRVENAPEYPPAFQQPPNSTMQFRLSSGVVLRFGKI